MARPLESPTWLVRIVGAILIFSALRAGHELLVPFALSVLLALLLAPIVNGLERLRVGRTGAVILTVVLTAIMVVGVGWMITRQITEVARRLPDYRANVIAKSARMGPVGELLQRGYVMVEDAGTQLSRARNKEVTTTPPFKPADTPPETVSSGALDLLGEFFLSLFNTLGSGFIVLLLVVFLLIYRDDLRDRLIQVFGAAQVKVTTQAMEDAATSVSSYLLTQSIVNLAYGVIVSLGLLALGIPNPHLWGILAALSRFVPYFGPWLGAALPVFLSFAVFPGWTRSLVLVTSWLAVEITIGNVVEPLLYGKKTGISPVAVLVAAVFWTWAWGGLGLLLSIPLTVSLVVLGKHFTRLGFLHTLLSEDATIEPRIQLYQRLLARDQQAAEELVESTAQHKPVVDVFDQLILPTLSLAHEDRLWGRLEDPSSDFIRRSLAAIVEDLADRVPGTEAPPIVSAQGAPHRVLCIPVSDNGDELAARMIQRVLESRHVHTETLAGADTVGEKARLAAERSPDVVILVALHPTALIPVRYLHKKIRSVLPGTDVLVAMLQAPGEARTWSQQIGSKDAPPVATSVHATESSIAQLLPPLLVARAAAP